MRFEHALQAARGLIGQFEPQGAMADSVNLGSFPEAGVAVVFGANGGIGGVLVEAIGAAERFEHVVAFSRSLRHQLTCWTRPVSNPPWRSPPIEARFAS
jgi:hypothetical protein